MGPRSLSRILSVWTHRGFWKMSSGPALHLSPSSELHPCAVGARVSKQRAAGSLAVGTSLCSGFPRQGLPPREGCLEVKGGVPVVFSHLSVHHLDRGSFLHFHLPERTHRSLLHGRMLMKGHFVTRSPKAGGR